jgi:hypothetical protein
MGYPEPPKSHKKSHKATAMHQRASSQTKMALNSQCEFVEYDDLLCIIDNAVAQLAKISHKWYDDVDVILEMYVSGTTVIIDYQ